MEDMNVIEMVAENNAATLEAPVCEAACGTETKGSIVGAVVATGTIIVAWEGIKRITKKLATGIKTRIAEKQAAKAAAKEEADTVEVECVEED